METDDANVGFPYEKDIKKLIEKAVAGALDPIKHIIDEVKDLAKDIKTKVGDVQHTTGAIQTVIDAVGGVPGDLAPIARSAFTTVHSSTALVTRAAGDLVSALHSSEAAWMTDATHLGRVARSVGAVPLDAVGKLLDAAPFGAIEAAVKWPSTLVTALPATAGAVDIIGAFDALDRAIGSFLQAVHVDWAPPTTIQRAVLKATLDLVPAQLLDLVGRLLPMDQLADATKRLVGVTATLAERAPALPGQAVAPTGTEHMVLVIVQAVLDAISAGTTLMVEVVPGNVAPAVAVAAGADAGAGAGASIGIQGFAKLGGLIQGKLGVNLPEIALGAAVFGTIAFLAQLGSLGIGAYLSITDGQLARAR